MSHLLTKKNHIHLNSWLDHLNLKLRKKRFPHEITQEKVLIKVQLRRPDKNGGLEWFRNGFNT